MASGQQVHNATCLFCSVQVEGDVSGRVVVLFGSVNVSGQIRQSATVIWGNAVVDSQARIGGDTVVLGGNAVYETDESLSGSAYVVGGHLSRVSRPKGEKLWSRVSLSPRVAVGLGGAARRLLSVFIVPRVRSRSEVKETS